MSLDLNTQKPRSFTEHLQVRQAKANARRVFLGAVQSGRLHRPDKCSMCGKVDFVEGHHNDYYKPLDVEWLCSPCHLWFHTRMKAWSRPSYRAKKRTAQI
jgi:hypothetical protein